MKNDQMEESGMGSVRDAMEELIKDRLKDDPIAKEFMLDLFNDLVCRMSDGQDIGDQPVLKKVMKKFVKDLKREKRSRLRGVGPEYRA